MSLILQDSGSALWAVTVDDNGVLTQTPGTGAPSTIVLNDAGSSTSWTLGISTVGNLTTTSTTFGANPTYVRLISTSGLTAWTLSINGIGDIVTTPAALGFEEDSFSVLVGAVPSSPINVW